jgi:hypothetical protein
MNSQPQHITLISKKTQKRRIVHLVTKTQKKSFMSASTICRHWVLKQGYPISFHTSYGTHETWQRKQEEFTNDMICNSKEDFELALQAFVKEYYE